MKLSKEKIKQIKKFCETHPKIDALKRFGVNMPTIVKYTKGINWKKPKQ